MHTLTRESARAAGACYSDERLAELIPEEGLTPAQVAALDIPADDRRWALVYACEADDSTLRLHAVWCARRANPADPRSLAALDVAERHARGEATDEELAAAWAPAWDAAWAAAWDAGAAAWAAARAAAEAASWAAAGAVAWAAEREAQVADLAGRLA